MDIFADTDRIVIAVRQVCAVTDRICIDTGRIQAVIDRASDVGCICAVADRVSAAVKISAGAAGTIVKARAVTTAS